MTSTTPMENSPTLKTIGAFASGAGFIIATFLFVKTMGFISFEDTISLNQDIASLRLELNKTNSVIDSLNSELDICKDHKKNNSSSYKNNAQIDFGNSITNGPDSQLEKPKAISQANSNTEQSKNFWYLISHEGEKAIRSIYINGKKTPFKSGFRRDSVKVSLGNFHILLKGKYEEVIYSDSIRVRPPHCLELSYDLYGWKHC